MPPTLYLVLLSFGLGALVGVLISSTVINFHMHSCHLLVRSSLVSYASNRKGEMMIVSCPSCGADMHFDIEETDDGAADIYGPMTYYQAWYNYEKNTEHSLECTLTQAQIEDMENRPLIPDEDGWRFQE